MALFSAVPWGKLAQLSDLIKSWQGWFLEVTLFPDPRRGLLRYLFLVLSSGLAGLQFSSLFLRGAFVFPECPDA